MFVTGNLLLTGAGEVGLAGPPGRAALLRRRLPATIAITGAHHFAANLYAPRAT